ncbi:MAG: hypothetical protein LBQ59_04040 [Candidatus Peribacteria bacterium]|jgi:hypothetical protein|nr:hypothetical protein [Candidatus Peribacteria bacterium]
MYPEKYICKEELKKIIEKELSGKEIVEIPREFKRNSANEESKKRG